MSRPRTHRAIAGIALAVLLATAAPARAAGFLEGALPPQDLWTRAWSWLMDLWVGGDRAQGPAVPATLEKGSPGPPQHPQGQSPARPRDAHGEEGSGIDPDG
jgi:hypothetical protein